MPNINNCNHVFSYPVDKKENYDGGKLIGRCGKCGTEQKSHGMRWSIPVCDDFLREAPSHNPDIRFSNKLDKSIKIC